MPSFRRSARRDESALTDESLAALLAGTQPPEDAPPDLRQAFEVLSALRTGPARDELADEAAALAEFRINGARPRAANGSRRRAVRLPSLSAKIAAATAVVAVAIGGVATAAVIGVLPGSAQRALHDVLPVIPAREASKHQTRPPRRTDHRSQSAARCVTCHARHHPSNSDRTRPQRHPRCTPAWWWTHPKPSWTPTVRPDPTRSPGWWSAWERTSCGARWRWRQYLRHKHGRGLHGPFAPQPTRQPGHHRVRVPMPGSGHQPSPRPSSLPTPRHSSQPDRRHHVSRT